MSRADLHILLVEDDALSSRLVGMLLERRGHRVHRASRADEARGLLAGQAFDLVVTDLSVPGGGGLTLLRELRSAPDLSHVAVVAVTGHSSPADRQRGLEQGFDAYITKPVEPATFAHQLEAAWRSRRERTDSVSTSK